MFYQKASRRKIRTYLEIVFLFITPVVLLYTGIVPRSYYVGVLAVYTSFVLLLIIHEHWTFKTLDIRLDNLRRCLLPYTTFTLVGTIALIALATLIGKEHVPPQNLYWLFLGWSIPIGFVQEFLYRGFLMHELRRLYASIGLVILANALLFAFLHLLYAPLGLILPLTFVTGIGFAWMYHKYPNLILISLSHGILNFVAILYSFF